jgi:peptidyl-prolyl cis-trans isomerase C
MTKLFVKMLLLGVAAVVFAFSGSAQDNKAKDKMIELFGDSVVAKGQGFEIKRSQLDSQMITLKSAAAGRGQPLPPNADGLILKNLISMQVLLAKATDEDRVKGKELFKQGVEKLKASSKLSDEDFNERMNLQIKSQGQTREEWEKQGLEQATVQALVERELKVVVTDAQVKKFYDDNPSRFEQPEMVRASHVLIATRDLTLNQEFSAEKKAEKKKLAADVQKRAKGGEDFAKLAKLYSDDPGSKDNGGEYTFPRGQMVPEFETAAFTLGTNEVSEVITTQFGYHVIKVSEKLPAKTVEFSKVEQDLRDGLRQQETQKLFPDYLEKVMAEAKVEILDEKLKLPDDPGRKASAKATNSPAKDAGRKD